MENIIIAKKNILGFNYKYINSLSYTLTNEQRNEIKMKIIK